jgi:hypothetical protein
MRLGVFLAGLPTGDSLNCAIFGVDPTFETLRNRDDCNKQ